MTTSTSDLRQIHSIIGNKNIVYKLYNTILHVGIIDELLFAYIAINSSKSYDKVATISFVK